MIFYCIEIDVPVDEVIVTLQEGISNENIIHSYNDNKIESFNDVFRMISVSNFYKEDPITFNKYENPNHDNIE